jgi:Putative peptidoglycan binding domain
VPRKSTAENGTPRRRRGADSGAIEASAGRGLAMRILLHSPKDTVAGALAFAAASAIIANALFLQPGRHPAPMFRPVGATSAAGLAHARPLPRPRPAEADTAVSEQRSAEPKLTDPLGNLVKATGIPLAAPATIARPPAPIPVSRHEAMASSASHRVAAVQRALTEYGYGQLRPTGTVGPDTQAAIQKFEHSRKIPVTGQISDRLVHELGAMIGHPIE